LRGHLQEFEVIQPRDCGAMAGAVAAGLHAFLHVAQRKAESLYCTGNGRENRFEVLTLPPGQGESADWTDP